MCTSVIIEIGEEAAGIVVSDDRASRFFSANRPYDKLEGALFNSPRQAEVAARALRLRQLGVRAPNTPPPALNRA